MTRWERIKRAAEADAAALLGIRAMLPEGAERERATDPRMEAQRTRSDVADAFAYNESMDRTVPSQMAEPAIVQDHAI